MNDAHLMKLHPCAAFNNLDNYLSASAKQIILEPAGILTLSAEEPEVTFIREGTVKIRRAKDECLLSISPPPSIIGLSSLYFPGNEDLKITAISRCVLYSLKTEHCKSLLDQHMLWHDVFLWMSWLYRMRGLRDEQLVGRTSYSKICDSLRIMDSWMPELRTRVGALDYIIERTRLSRSVVAEILSALRKGGYITMSKGKLISVRLLPREY